MFGIVECQTGRDLYQVVHFQVLEEEKDLDQVEVVLAVILVEVVLTREVTTTLKQCLVRMIMRILILV